MLKITGYGIETEINIIDFKTYKFPDEVRDSILRNSDNKTAKLAEICRLNVILGKLFADAVKNICRRNFRVRKDPECSGQLDFIGSHGQTIHHLPDGNKYLGYELKSTLQIGDPSVIANLTGITTVGDFRIADCASGGSGAPLVPYLDYIVFRSRTVNRGLLNIGGIANITVIPKDAAMNEVIAFDTGPGNMIIDGLMKKLYRKDYDRGGMISASGKINFGLFKFLLKDRYYRQRPPKSTGREHYGSAFLEKILSQAKRIHRKDIIRTVTVFTAYTIAYNYKRFVKHACKIDELIISGGGARNKYLVGLIREYMDKVRIREINEFGITTDSKEAVLFAVLANECIAGNPANLRSVTGAKKDAILGKICLAQV